MNAIEIINLKKSYDGREFALEESSFSIARGEVFGFLGPNGSGKTTTVRLLNGILTPSGGHALVMGKDIVKDRAEIHRLCGVMTETALLYENLTGLENLKFFGRLHGMNDRAIQERGLALFRSFELTEAKNRKLKTYSTGMKRRLSLARALLHSPKVLFLDEPTSGLDPEAATNVTQMIRKLSVEHGVTVFLCTHQLKYAEEICTLYGFIHQGKILGLGTFEQLLRQKNSKTYLEIRGEELPTLESSEITSEGKLRVPIDSDGDVTAILQDILSRGGKVFEAKQVRWNLEDLYFRFQKGEVR
ncbi:MAG: Daunorubicin/doxorubicin resistance ATP-binding protein DrrA [Candidatus Dichloromethanomonas elyunquensis]|nr:MAG: Daunorubicin/doxorubicin resistance ATP-binding protein DrrA [Candidatus Dichloromethanomonas elyunquensis]